jgi:hypothetical protein
MSREFKTLSINNGNHGVYSTGRICQATVFLLSKVWAVRTESWAVRTESWAVHAESWAVHAESWAVPAVIRK